MNEYTSVNFWDEEWKDQRIERYIEERIDSQILKLIRPVLKEKCKVLEVGCVPGGKLKFLKRNFNVEPYGLDYSWYGLKKSIKDIHLVCADLSYPPFRNSFDLVFSMGVIEHFANPLEVIKIHFDLIKQDGIVLITIPNFSTFSTLTTAFKIGRRFNKVKQSHNMKLMQIRNFRELFSNVEVEVLFCDYYGPPMVYLPPNSFLKKLNTKINHSIDKFALRSSILSPNIVFVGRKSS